MRDVPPLSVRQAAVVDVLSGLSRDLVHLLVERERVVADPFTAALRRYRVLGEPKEIGGSWRQLLVRDGERRALARLGRDLLEAVAPREVRRIALPAVAVRAQAERTIATWPTTLVFAGPFDDASRLDALTDAVALLPGVRHVSVEPADAGMVWLHVAYAGAAPLGTLIAPLAAAPPVVAARHRTAA